MNRVEVGTKILSYTVTEKIGEGGMAAVYRGVHEHLGQEVAIKVLDPLLARDSELRERFVQEARIQSSLRHPNLVQVLTAHISDDLLCLIQDLVPGRSLEEVIASRKKLPTSEALVIMGQVLDAVQYAHDHSVVHRDLKPGNIIVCADGTARVTDFGIAKITGDLKLTRTGTTMGTAAYMAPEQVLGAKEVGPRADIYALGVVLFEMLTGRPPFIDGNGSNSGSDFLVKQAHVQTTAPLVRTFEPSVPGHIEAAISRALEKDAAKRFSSCSEFSRAISEGKAEDVAQILSPSTAPMPDTSNRKTGTALADLRQGFTFTRRDFANATTAERIGFVFSLPALIGIYYWLSEHADGDAVSALVTTTILFLAVMTYFGVRKKSSHLTMTVSFLFALLFGFPAFVVAVDAFDINNRETLFLCSSLSIGAVPPIVVFLSLIVRAIFPRDRIEHAMAFRNSLRFIGTCVVLALGLVLFERITAPIQIDAKAFNAYQMWSTGKGKPVHEYPKWKTSAEAAKSFDAAFAVSEAEWYAGDRFVGKRTKDAFAKEYGNSLVYPERSGFELRLSVSKTSNMMGFFEAVNHCKEKNMRLPTIRELFDYCTAWEEPDWPIDCVWSTSVKTLLHGSMAEPIVYVFDSKGLVSASLGVGPDPSANMGLRPRTDYVRVCQVICVGPQE